MRERVEVTPCGAPDDGDERRLIQCRDIRHRHERSLVELLRRDRADTPEPLHRQRVEERELFTDRDDEQAIGFAHGARHLRQELRPRDAHGDGDADLLSDRLPQSGADLRRGARDPPQSADVEERLVDRESFDERRRVPEDREHRLARLRVRLHPRTHDDGLGAEAAGLPLAHGCPHAEGLRFVAGSQDDPAAHDHGAAAQRRVVSLLDRRVERVGVRVEDRALFDHPAMLAAPTDTRRQGGEYSRSFFVIETLFSMLAPMMTRATIDRANR